jgi:hypothetical protein
VVILTVLLPIVVVPSVNITAAFGLPPYCPVTAAVKVTVCPLVDGFGVEVRVVVVGAWFTVRFTAGDGLAPKFVDPG